MGDKQSELDKKYHVLALEYSKVRSQATVLKKAVLDEQNKNTELKELLTNTEQKLRKRDQEIDSLTFRNEQLTKRISVLQQELQSNNHGKKSKNKVSDHSFNIGIVDEELHKKILENAELVSRLADKDMEIGSSKEQIGWLEQKLNLLKSELAANEEQYQSTRNELLQEKQKNLLIQDHKSTSIGCTDEKGQSDSVSTPFWQEEAKRWKTECEMLRLKPSTDEELTKYYESHIRIMLESTQMAQSKCRSLEADNIALGARLEQIILEKNHLEKSILTNADELNTTSNNYKIQLDAMTEHLAGQNETIAKQCDAIYELKHRLTLKK